jgi:hypothetical protein
MALSFGSVIFILYLCLNNLKQYIMKKFDYLILSEENEWLSTGNQETEEQLNSEIERLKSEDEERELIVYKAEIMESYSC